MCPLFGGFTVYVTTSVKIIQLNEWRCRDAPCEKLWKQEVPLAILSRILAQSCVTPPYIYSGKGVTHDYASILDSIDSIIFRMVLPYIAIHSVE